MTEYVIPTTNDYHVVHTSIGRYRYARIPLNNITGTSIQLGVSSSTLCEFKIPSNTCFNLAQSFIGYNYQIVAGGAGYYPVSFETGQDLCNWIFFGSSGQLGMCDLANVDRYADLIRSIRTPQPEFLASDIDSLNYPCYQPATSNYLPFSRDGLVTGTACASTNGYMEPQYLNIGSQSNTTLTVNRFLPLSAFKDTVFGMNKDMFFGIDTYIRFMTQWSSRLGFYTSDTTHPCNTNTVIAISSTAMYFNNLYLYLAIQENVAVVEQLRSQVLGPGMHINIPYTYGYKFTQAGNSSSCGISLTLTRQFGHRLKRILWAPFAAQGEVGGSSANLFKCHANINGTSINYFQTSLDSRPLTDYPINCFNAGATIGGTVVNPTGVGWVVPAATNTGGSIGNDDYREAIKFLRGSCIPTYGEYQSNWMACDSWGIQNGISGLKQLVDDSNIEDGLDLLDGDHVYNIIATTVASTTNTNIYYASGIYYYLFVLYARKAIIDRNGITFA